MRPTSKVQISQMKEKHNYSLRRGDILMIRSNGSISIVGECAPDL